MFRMQATAERINGRYEDWSRRNKELRPPARTISSWYFSSEARLRSASAAWHCTLGDEESIRLTNDCTSFGSEAASLRRLLASTAMLLKAVVQ